jgi:hypothetical protein
MSVDGLQPPGCIPKCPHPFSKPTTRLSEVRTQKVRVQVQTQANLDPNHRSRSSWWVDRTWTDPLLSISKSSCTINKYIYITLIKKDFFLKSKILPGARGAGVSRASVGGGLPYMDTKKKLVEQGLETRLRPKPLPSFHVSCTVSRCGGWVLVA